MKTKGTYLIFLLLYAAFFIPLFTIAQAPDLSKLNSDKEKTAAWLAYCETLRLNGSGLKNNYIILQEAGLKGLTMVNAADAENRSKFLFYTGIGYYYQVKQDSAEYYFYESLHEGQKGHFTKQISKACVVLIPVTFQLQHTDKTEECKNILQSIIDTSHNQSILQDGYYALGSYYQQKTYYSTAQDYFIKSLQSREKEVDTTQELKKKFDYAIQCDMLSKLYLNTQMPDKSIDALRKGQRFAEVSPNVSNRLLSSFVEAYTTSGNIDSALFYLGKLETKTKNDPIYPSEIFTSNLNIAIYYVNRKLYNKALPYLNKADTIAGRIQSPYLVFQEQMIKGRYLQETGKPDQAIPVLMQAIPVARQLNKDLYGNILKSLALAQKEKGNTSSALQYFEQYEDVEDSVNKEKISRTFADLETHYQTNEKEQRIVSLDKENRLKVLELQNASRTRLLLILGLISLGVIALLLYFIYRNKEKANTVLNKQNDQLEILNTQLAVANETKAKLFSIIGHDLRSPASQIVQLLQLQKENPGLLNEQSRLQHEARLKTASENVLETMEDLLLWSKSQMQHFTPQMTAVSISGTLQKELNLLQQRIEDKKLEVERSVPETFIQQTDENFISVIIRNLLQNAVKYSDEGSTISIKAGAQKLHITNRSAQADAIALNALLQNKKVNSKSSGLGLQIANDLAVAIGASISFEQQESSKITATLSWV